MDTWYTRNHSNNLIIELLATMGILGFGAFFVFTSCVVYQLVKSLAACARPNLLIGLGGILIVFFIHSIFDYFLPWTPTLGFFWITCGLILAISQWRDNENLHQDNIKRSENGDLHVKEKLG
jgi:O-antigen ligase